MGREHVVPLNRNDATRLAAFATRPNGAMRLADRLTIEAVEGGGLLIRTLPVGLRDDVQAVQALRDAPDTSRPNSERWLCHGYVLAAYDKVLALLRGEAS